MDDSGQLRALHDSYVWEVNAAVGEGRHDLVWQLADQYLDEAFRIVAGDEAAGCGRPDCTICAGRGPAPVPPRRRRHLLRRLLG